MQIASAAPRNFAGPVPTADVNVSVLATSPVADDGTFTVDTLQVTVRPDHRDGGFVMRSTHHPNGFVRMDARQVLGNPRERAAAQAVRDAVQAGGLLAEARSDGWIGRPEHGRTRIYFDRRSSFVEFATNAPTPAIQSVLDAVAAWAATK